MAYNMGMTYEIKTLYKADCIKCNQTCELAAFKADMDAWVSGKLIQDAMPYLSDDERELCISRICGKCFDAMYDNEE